MADQGKKTSAANYSPILTFVIAFFILRIFDWPDATYFTLASFISLATYMIEIYLLKQEKKISAKNNRQFGFYYAMLTIFFMLVVVAAFLSWYRMVSISARTALLLIAVVSYLVVLFRAINVFIEIKMSAEDKK